MWLSNSREFRRADCSLEAELWTMLNCHVVFYHCPKPRREARIQFSDHTGYVLLGQAQKINAGPLLLQLLQRSLAGTLRVQITRVWNVAVR